jgi:DNA-binding transcriptional ArsR family regulator
MTLAAREKIPHPAAEAIDLATVMRTLAERGETHCGELSEAFGIPASTGSYHLRLLREAGVTRTRAEGTQRFISVRGEDLERRFPGLLDVLTRG